MEEGAVIDFASVVFCVR